MKAESEKALTKRRRLYNAAVDKELRTSVRGTGWKKREHSIFRELDSFFVVAFNTVHLNQDKVTWSLQVKPMAVDPVFWSIMDLESNASEPLSLRAWGWFTCGSVPVAEKEIDAPLPSPPDIAASFMEWADHTTAEFLRQNGSAPFSRVIQGHVNYRERGAYAETLVSTLIVEGRSEEAAAVADQFRSADRTTVLTQANEGQSFFDRAAKWLVTSHE